MGEYMGTQSLLKNTVKDKKHQHRKLTDMILQIPRSCKQDWSALWKKPVVLQLGNEALYNLRE